MFRNLTVLKNIVVGLLLAWGLLMLIGAWTSWQTYQFYKRLTAADFGPDEDVMAIATWLDNSSVVLMWTSVGMFLATVVAFCIWTYQAARNAKGLSSIPQKMSPGWTVGWYFVPFANFWKPFQGMREIWWRSAWPQTKYAPPILNIWWILWIALSLIDKVVGRLFRAEDLELLATANAAMMVVQLAWLAPTIILVWIVDRVTRMQVAKHAAHPDGPADVVMPIDKFSAAVSAV